MHEREADVRVELLVALGDLRQIRFSYAVDLLGLLLPFTGKTAFSQEPGELQDLTAFALPMDMGQFCVQPGLVHDGFASYRL